MNSLVHLVLLTLAPVVLCIACGPAMILSQLGDRMDEAARAKNSQTEIATGNSCATKDDTSIAADAVVQRDSVVLIRKSQIVKRLDCDGQPLDPDWQTNWEDVVKPSMRYTLEAKTLEPGTGADIDSPYNRSNCEYISEGLAKFWDSLQVDSLFDEWSAQIKPTSPLAPLTPPVPRMHFTIDVANTTFHSRVLEGENYIDYAFRVPCSDNDPSCQLSDQPILEKGTLILTMRQEVEHLEGVKEIEVCQPVTKSSIDSKDEIETEDKTKQKTLNSGGIDV